MSNRYKGAVISATPPSVSRGPGAAFASGIWTPSQQAVYQAAGTWPLSDDPNFNQTVLLLHGDGTNGAQNNTFLDSSTNNFTITRNGNTTQGTFSPFSNADGEWSNYFSANGDYLSTASAVIPQSADFTIELWIYPTSISLGLNGVQGLVSQFTDGTTNRMSLALDDGVPYLTTNGTTRITSTISVSQDEWTHIALVRDSGTDTLYVNGVSGGTAASTNIQQTGLNIGRFLAGGNDRTFRGYMSNLRISDNARTISVPTSPYSDDANTLFLSCQSNRFVDNATPPSTITVNGNTSVQPFSPFQPSSAYSTSVNGGSGYFDGTGDYLTAADDAAFAIGTGDFTSEGWFYTSDTTRTQNAVRQTMCRIGGIRLSLNSSTGALSYVLATGSGFVDGTEIAQQGAWNHFAIVRSGSDLSLFLNGVRADTTTDTTNLTENDCLIGGNTSTTGLWLGYLAGIRFVNGTAVYDPTQTTLTVPTAPPTAITNTEVLCNFTNAGIFDNTGKNNLETVADAQIDTTTKKWGTGSLEFDGTGDWLIAAHNVEQLFGTGPFTIEGWIYPTWVTPDSNEPIIAKGDSSATGTWQLDVQSTSVLRFAWNSGSSFASTGTITPNQWTHIAVVREGTGTNETKIYINGVNDGTGTVSQDFTNTGLLKIGRNRDNSTAFDGLVDDLRITKGVARYTANFTPPNGPFFNT